MVPVEQLLECIPVTADVRGEQLGIGTRPFGLLPRYPEYPHSRTLNGAVGGF